MYPLPASWGIVAERLHAIACRALGSATRAPRPAPSDQREGLCFIRTMLSGWADGAIYRYSDERTAALDGWLWHYNCQRRHSASATSPRSLVLTREEPTRDVHLGPMAALARRQGLRTGPHGKTTSEAMLGGRLHDPAESTRSS